MGHVDGVADAQRTAAGWNDMNKPFDQRMMEAQIVARSSVGLLLSPKLTAMPLPMQRYDDPFLPFGKAIIDATRDIICLVMFDFAAYLTIGAAGIVALERTIAYASASHILMALHVPFASSAYVEAVSPTALNVDAVTVSNSAYAPVYDKALNGGVFVMNHAMSHEYGSFIDTDLYLAIPFSTPPLGVYLLGDDVIYSERGDDFAEAIRTKVDEQRRRNPRYLLNE